MKDELIAGTRLTGIYVQSLKDKTFKILEAQNVDLPSFRDPDKMDRKLMLTVQLADGTQIEYIPNGKSKAFIMSTTGIHLSDLADYEGEFCIIEQVVGSKGLLPVIYIVGSV